MKLSNNKTRYYSFNQCGFTLLEIMVALLLISIVIVSVIELSSANLRNLAASDDQVEAVIRANSKMREILDLDKLEDKSWIQTDDQGYSYEIKIGETLPARTESLPVKLTEVTVITTWLNNNKKKNIILQTTKIVLRSDALKSNEKPAI